MSLSVELKAKLVQAMKDKDDAAKSILRVLIGNISNREAKGGSLKDEEVHSIIRSLIENNKELIETMIKHNQQSHASYATLNKENLYLSSLLPVTLSQAQIKQELMLIASEIKAAPKEGAAIGMAVKFLSKSSGVALGADVKAVVQEMRL